MTKQQPPPGDEDVDYEGEAIKQIENFEPDELDGPAANLDRTLDDENPGGDGRG